MSKKNGITIMYYKNGKLKEKSDANNDDKGIDSVLRKLIAVSIKSVYLTNNRDMTFTLSEPTGEIIIDISYDGGVIFQPKTPEPVILYEKGKKK